MSSPLKQIITILVLASFLALAIFSFSAISHGSNDSMPGGCPFSVQGGPICPQNIFATAIHHISILYSFFNVPVSINMTSIIGLLILVAYALVVFTITVSHTLFTLSPFVGNIYNFPTFGQANRKIQHWLALFENSPSRQ